MKGIGRPFIHVYVRVGLCRWNLTENDQEEEMAKEIYSDSNLNSRF